MLKRRDFLKTTVGATAAALLAGSPHVARAARAADQDLSFSSPGIELTISPTAPEFLSLNIDGLGKGRRGPSAIDTSRPGVGLKASSSRTSGALRVEYRPQWVDDSVLPPWTFEVTDRRVVATSQWSAAAEPVPMTFRFNLNQVHSTVLGLFQHDGLLATPALLHFPGQGSMRLTADVPGLGLTYASDRPRQTATLSLPGATCAHQRVIYTFDVTAIHPELHGIAGDPRFDAFRRNWLDALQLNPGLQALANNTASDTCAFCYYEYADIAALTPPLAPGLTAIDIVKQTLERVLAGGQAYGLPGLTNFLITASSDTYPSMLIAAADCVRAGGNDAWLAANYEGIPRLGGIDAGHRQEWRRPHQIRIQRQLRQLARADFPFQAVELVGHHRLRLRRRLQQCARLSRLSQLGHDGARARQGRRCGALLCRRGQAPRHFL